MGKRQTMVVLCGWLFAFAGCQESSSGQQRDGGQADALIAGDGTTSSDGSASSDARSNRDGMVTHGPYSWNRAADQLVIAYSRSGGGFDWSCAAIAQKTPCNFINVMGDGTVYVGGRTQDAMVRVHQLCPSDVAALLQKLAPESWSSTPTAYGTAGLCDGPEEKIKVSLGNLGSRAISYSGYCAKSLPSNVVPVTAPIKDALDQIRAQAQQQANEIRPEAAWATLHGPLAAPQEYLPEAQYVYPWPATSVDPTSYLHANYNEAFKIGVADLALIAALARDPKSKGRFVSLAGGTYEVALVGVAPPRGIGIRDDCNVVGARRGSKPSRWAQRQVRQLSYSSPPGC
ncbi:MAG: hypothetical protein H6707_18110 [Deltaproteobacteria bacterium]|nr:hypothetical protein [Deltaproteobacteria bacterium]